MLNPHFKFKLLDSSRIAIAAATQFAVKNRISVISFKMSRDLFLPVESQ